MCVCVCASGMLFIQKETILIQTPCMHAVVTRPCGHGQSAHLFTGSPQLLLPITTNVLLYPDYTSIVYIKLSLPPVTLSPM